MNSNRQLQRQRHFHGVSPFGRIIAVAVGVAVGIAVVFAGGVGTEVARAQSAAEPHRVTVLDETGQVVQRNVRIAVQAIDFDREMLRATTEGGTVEWPFSRLDAGDLYNVLFAQFKVLEADAKTDTERRQLSHAHLVTARFALAHEHLPPMLDRAERHLKAAEQASSAHADAIAGQWVIWHELSADRDLASIREQITSNDLITARRNLDRLLDRHAQTAAAREAETLLAGILRQLEAQQPDARPTPTPGRPDRQRPDPLAPIEDALSKAAEKYAEGYRRYAETRASHCLVPWREGLALLDDPRTGALARLTLLAANRPPGLDIERAKRLTARVQDERLRFYKTLAHYHLYATSFTEAESVLKRALELRPADREVLLLQLIVDENKIRILGVNPVPRPPANQPNAQPGDAGQSSDSSGNSASSTGND